MRGYSENEDGHVVLTMSREDYANLLISLGMAAGCALGQSSRNDPSFGRMLAFVNRINQGNPNFTPYETPDDQR